jgi:hypothetical protein
MCSNVPNWRSLYLSSTVICTRATVLVPEAIRNNSGIYWLPPVPLQALHTYASSLPHCTGDSTIISSLFFFFGDRKLRHREVKRFAQGHRAIRVQIPNSQPRSLAWCSGSYSLVCLLLFDAPVGGGECLRQFF